MSNLRLFFFLVGSLSLTALACGQHYPKGIDPHSPVDHGQWDALLKEYVSPEGWVDYRAWQKDTVRLQAYLDLLSSAHPQPDWSREEEMAYWINAYNAFTVELVLDHYPVESIKDIKRGIPFVNSVWDIRFIRIQGEEYDLNRIEHGILRKYFADARVHAALNCASYSCPRLRGEAYIPARLDEQLDDAMRIFVNDPLRNRVQAGQAELSKIFSWYGGDFKEDAGSLRQFIDRYAVEPLSEDGQIRYLEYDWSLNDEDLH